MLSPDIRLFDIACSSLALSRRSHIARGFAFAILIGTARVISAIRKLFGAVSPSANRELLPEGLRIYAVGDVHGRADLLRAILNQIAEDTQERPVREAVEVFLGDYVDRGPNSRDVIETLITTPA